MSNMYEKFLVFSCSAVALFLQVTFTVVFLFSPTRTEPILIPIFALYAGNIGRMILDAGFWYVLVRRKLPNQAKDQVSKVTCRGR